MKFIIAGMLIVLNVALAEAMIQPEVYFSTPADQKVLLGRDDVAQLRFNFKDSTVTFDENGCGPLFFNGTTSTTLEATCTLIGFQPTSFTAKVLENVIYVIPKGKQVGFILNKDKTVGAVYPLPLPDDPSQLANEKVVSWFELSDMSDMSSTIPDLMGGYKEPPFPSSVSIARSKVLHVGPGKNDVKEGKLNINFKNSTITFYDRFFPPSLKDGQIKELAGCGTVPSSPVTIRKIGKLIYVIPKESLKLFVTPLPVSMNRNVGFILNASATVGVVYPLPLPNNPAHLKPSQIIDWFNLHRIR